MCLCFGADAELNYKPNIPQIIMNCPDLLTPSWLRDIIVLKVLTLIRYTLSFNMILNKVQSGHHLNFDRSKAMAGYQMVQRIRQLEEKLTSLGIKLGPPQYTNEKDSYASLMPLGNDGLPIYARDASLFTASIEAIESWVEGVLWARDYDKMLGLSNTVKRERKEQDARNRILINKLGE